MAAPKKTTAAKKPAAKKAAAKTTVKAAVVKKSAVKKTTAPKTVMKKTVAPKTTAKKSAGKTLNTVEKRIVEQRYLILKSLDDGKAEDILDFDLRARSSLADYIVIASGRSTRHVSSLAENISKSLKQAGHKILHREGEGSNDWVIVDTGDIVVHIFRPEVRSYYRIEEIWQK